MRALKENKHAKEGSQINHRTRHVPSQGLCTTFILYFMSLIINVVHKEWGNVVLYVSYLVLPGGNLWPPRSDAPGVQFIALTDTEFFEVFDFSLRLQLIRKAGGVSLECTHVTEHGIIGKTIKMIGHPDMGPHNDAALTEEVSLSVTWVARPPFLTTSVPARDIEATQAREAMYTSDLCYTHGRWLIPRDIAENKSWDGVSRVLAAFIYLDDPELTEFLDAPLKSDSDFVTVVDRMGDFKSAGPLSGSSEGTDSVAATVAAVGISGRSVDFKPPCPLSGAPPASAAAGKEEAEPDVEGPLLLAEEEETEEIVFNSNTAATARRKSAGTSFVGAAERGSYREPPPSKTAFRNLCNEILGSPKKLPRMPEYLDDIDISDFGAGPTECTVSWHIPGRTPCSLGVRIPSGAWERRGEDYSILVRGEVDAVFILMKGGNESFCLVTDKDREIMCLGDVLLKTVFT